MDFFEKEDVIFFNVTGVKDGPMSEQIGHFSKQIGSIFYKGVRFDRDDDSITVCEIKYTDHPFSIDKQYAENLKRKIAVFKEATRISKQIFFSMVSASGISKTIYSEDMVDGVVDLEDFFKIT